MRKSLLLALALVLVAATAYAYLGQILGSFRSPAGTNTRGLARAATYLYIINGNNRATVYQVRPFTGSIYTWYMLSWTAQNSGLAFSTPSNLWVGRLDTERVYRVEAHTGSVFDYWSAGHDPYGLAPWCNGDGGTGTSYLFGTDDAPSRLYVHRLSNGSIVSSASLVNTSRCDCAFDWRNNLIWRGRAGSIYGVTPSGAIAASFPSPAGNPRGMAYYNTYLWVACNANGFVYRLHCPRNFSAVTPSSLGKVRAIFR